MQKRSDPSSFLANSMGAPHGDEDDLVLLRLLIILPTIF